MDAQVAEQRVWRALAGWLDGIGAERLATRDDAGDRLGDSEQHAMAAAVARVRSQLETPRADAAVSTERLPIREALGMAVREAWVRWAATQPDVSEHPSWLVPWAELPERDREVDRLIGEAVVRALPTDIEAPTSALPWMYDAPDYIVCVAEATAVVRIDGGWPADAAYIVAACNGYPGLLARLKAAERQRDNASAGFHEARAEIARMSAELAVVSTGVEGVWKWQGDGHDDPESLSCPVVMSAAMLREMIAAQRADAKQDAEKIASLEAEVARLSATTAAGLTRVFP